MGERISAEPKRERLTIRLNESLVNTLQEISSLTGVTASKLIRVFVIQGTNTMIDDEGRLKPDTIERIKNTMNPCDLSDTDALTANDI